MVAAPLIVHDDVVCFDPTEMTKAVHFEILTEHDGINCGGSLALDSTNF